MRLDQEKQEELEPKRMKFAENCINHLNLSIISKDSKSIRFRFKDEIITLFPYSGWFTGKSVKDGRGINNLLKQLNDK